MGIYIKGMKMPPDGACDQIVIDDDGKVYSTVDNCILKINSIATAIPVPPHGRLGDLDELQQLYSDTDNINIEDMFVRVAVVRQNIDDMYTIIPADKEDEQWESTSRAWRCRKTD